MDKKKTVLSICGIVAVVFLGLSILFHGFGMGAHMMRGAVPYSHGHGGWEYHH